VDEAGAGPLATVVVWPPKGLGLPESMISTFSVPGCPTNRKFESLGIS
jgi:hypothetical protein